MTEGGSAPPYHCYLQPSIVDVREWELEFAAEVNSCHLNASGKRARGQATSSGLQPLTAFCDQVQGFYTTSWLRHWFLSKSRACLHLVIGDVWLVQFVNGDMVLRNKGGFMTRDVRHTDNFSRDVTNIDITWLCVSQMSFRFNFSTGRRGNLELEWECLSLGSLLLRLTEGSHKAVVKELIQTLWD